MIGDSLWVLDAINLSASNAGRPEWQDAFVEKTRPFNNSSTWDTENNII
jgi:hypothetical protein